MSFHLGKPILVMLVLAVVCGIGIGLRPAARPPANLVVWVSAEAHRATYADSDDARSSLVEQFHQRTGKSVDVQLVSTRTEDVRLTSKFMSGTSDVPDAVEVEIN